LMGMYDAQPRPDVTTPSVVDSVARQLVVKMLEVTDEGVIRSIREEMGGMSLKVAIRHVSKLIAGRKHLDGTHLVRLLKERYCWFGDLKAVAVVLDDTERLLQVQALTEMRWWVTKNNLKPRLAAGQKAQYVQKRHGDVFEVRDVTVIEVHRTLARYSLDVDGQVVLVGYEDMHDLLTPPEEFELATQG